MRTATDVGIAGPEEGEEASLEVEGSAMDESTTEESRTGPLSAMLSRMYGIGTL